MSEQAANQLVLGIGLLVLAALVLGVPAAIIRFALARRKLGKGESAAVAFGSFLLAFTPIWFMTAEGEQVSPIIPFLAILTAWFICHYEKRRIW